MRKESLIYTVFALVVALIFWYQISPITFKDYDTACRANYGHTTEYDRCMNPYWSQYGLNRTGLIISLGLAGIFIVISIVNQISQKQRIS